DDAVGFPGGLKTLLRLRNRPGQRLFRVQILPGRECVQEMPGMNMQWSCDQDAVDVFAIENLAMVGERLEARGEPFGFVEAAGIDIGDGAPWKARARECLAEKFLPTRADTDNRDSY